MGVHDAWQGRGAGRALLAAALDMADRWLGLTRVELTVYADNLRAIGLYERFGFVREGLHRDFALRDGAYVDALAMARLTNARSGGARSEQA
jgi:putative acetyltransferase